MTSGCLDRKEVRGAIWGVHSTTDRPAGGNTGRLFLAFGGPVCADRISNCPLDRVLTYKNLIYLLNLQFCFPAGTVNFLLLRHENRDRLPFFAVNLDEDPTDIFGAVCALLVFSALLKNCNNYLLDNKTFLWPCLQWKEYCDF